MAATRRLFRRNTSRRCPQINQPAPLAKPLAFILSKHERFPDPVYQRLEKSFWPIEYKGRSHVFDCTDYYTREFGSPLYRRIICFKSLIDPSRLVSFKWIMYNIEREYVSNARRIYNFDMGYLDTDKLVLASFKRGKNKLYMGQDVYGDMLLEYAKGRFSPLPWAFEDFRDDRYHKDLLVVREKLKADLRK